MHPLAHIQFQTRTSNIKKNLFLQQGLGNPYGLRESHISQANSSFYSEIKRHHAALSSIIGGGACSDQIVDVTTSICWFADTYRKEKDLYSSWNSLFHFVSACCLATSWLFPFVTGWDTCKSCLRLARTQHRSKGFVTLRLAIQTVNHIKQTD